MLHRSAYLVQQSQLAGAIGDRRQDATVISRDGDAVDDCSPTNALRAVQSRSHAVHFGLRGASVAGYDDFIEICDLDIRAVVL